MKRGTVYVFVGLQQLMLVTIVLGQYQQQQQQHVPPGVNPQHYQHYDPNQPPQQQPQYQQPPQPQQVHSQPPVQQQQQQYQQPPPPQQQQQQQAPPQHDGGGGHQHHHRGHPPNVLASNVQDEKDHIAEHMEVPIDTSKMSEQELQFHYFKMHDSDNNNKLDGCELIKSLIHWHEEHGKETTSILDTDLEASIDAFLNPADLDNDGYISYVEFRIAKEIAKIDASKQVESKPPGSD